MTIDKDTSIALYQTMVLIRECEESFVEPILNREIRTPVHLYSGQEAVATGLCAHLNKEDYIFGNHRSHGHFLAKGGGLQELISEVYCKETGCAKGRGGSMHLIDPENGIMGIVPIVAGTISLAMGAALSSSIRKDEKVTVSFFGDGATGEGVLYESLNFAAIKKLPIIFACENNLYSTHMSIKDIRINNRIKEVAEPFGIMSFRVDGNNLSEVYEISAKAVELCRKGEGPVFLEFMTYRFRGHVGPDDNVQGKHTDIRPENEILDWHKKDPIVLFGQYLRNNFNISEKSLAEIKEAIVKDVLQAHKKAKADNQPDKKELLKNIFDE